MIKFLQYKSIKLCGENQSNKKVSFKIKNEHVSQFHAH